MPKKTRKLQLNKETLKLLDPKDLKKAAGGKPTGDSSWCGPTFLLFRCWTP